MEQHVVQESSLDKDLFLVMKIFNALPGNSLLISADAPSYTILAVTQKHLEFTRKKKDEIIGKSFFDVYSSNLIDPNDPGKNFRFSFNQVITSKEPHHLQVQRNDIPNASGNLERYWRVENTPVKNDDGDVSYIIHTVEEVINPGEGEKNFTADAIELALAKQKIEESEKKFHNLILKAPLGMCIVSGPDRMVEEINDAFLELVGKPRDAFKNASYWQVLEEAASIYSPIMDEVFATGNAYHGEEHELILIRKGLPETVYISFVYDPIKEADGSIKKIMILGLDVTAQVKARKEIEESEIKYRNLFDRMDQGFCILEMIFDANNHPVDYRFLQTNPVFEKQTGLKNAVGKTARELVPSLESHWFELYGNVALTGESIRFTEGSKVMGRWFEVYAFKIGDSESQKVALLFSDISERKKAEEIIRQSEQNLRNIILQAPVAMCLLRGSSFVVEVANERMYQLWGKLPEELLHRPVFDGIPEAKSQGLQEILQHVLTTGETFSATELPVRLQRNGVEEMVILNFVYEPIREGDGIISGIITVAIDVTAQVMTRMKIEESEAELKRFKFMADNAQDPFILMRHDGSFAYLNKKALDTWGYTEEEAQKLHVPDVDALFQMDDFRQVFGKAQVEAIAHLETVHRKKNGEEYPVELNMNGIVLNGVPHMLAIARDITERKKYETAIKESEAQLQQRVAERTVELENQKNLLDNILRNSSNGISVTEMILDNYGRVIDARTILANEAAVQLTGLPRDLYLTMRATELDPGIMEAPYGRTCLKTLETGEPALIQYFLAMTNKWLELTISKMDDDHLIHIFTDVTQIKEAQLRLQNSVDELKRSNANLEEFAYAASHDLKEPIRKIHFFGERIKESMSERMTPEEKTYFERQENAARRMASLIDDLLSYSQISIRPHTYEEVNMNQLIDLVLEDLDLEIEDKKAVISVDKLFSIQGHPRQLQQAFQNLIGNALKYSKPGLHPEIKITCQKTKGKEIALQLPAEEQQKDFYSISVIDNGIGFEQSDAERIFNVFTRLHGLAEYHGTGIGLSIVRKVMENHNGYITAESKPGVGSAFKVYLPVR